MSNDFQKGTVQRVAAEVDQGLRSFMLGVFNYMALGLLVTGLVSMTAASSPAFMKAVFGSGLSFVVMLAPLALALFLSFRINSMSSSTAQMVFWVYAGLMGISLSTIFLAYTGTSIAKVFFITAGTFGAMSIYGYTTQRDLTSLGTFLIMGVIGLVIASVVNLFIQSSMMTFIMSCAGVLIFTGLTAYDVQQLKSIYYQVADDNEQARKASIIGALNLYMDFINLFISLLRLIGERR